MRPFYPYFIQMSIYGIMYTKEKTMNDIMNLINKISYPLVLLGAINYGLIGLFQTDLLTYLPSAWWVTAVQVLIGFAGVGVAVGLLGRK